MTQAGQWRTPQASQLNELEIVNLSLYHALSMFQGVKDLPPLLTVPGYRNLPAGVKALDNRGLLAKITERETAINSFSALF